jgi:hypothetical protein
MPTALRQSFNVVGELIACLPIAWLAAAVLDSTRPGATPLHEQWGTISILLPFVWFIGQAAARMAKDGTLSGHGFSDPLTFARHLYLVAPFKLFTHALPLALLAFLAFGFAVGFGHMFGHSGY